MPRTRIELPDDLPFRTELTVRISDINYGGHLGNDAVLSLIQEARIRFLSQWGYAERNIDGVGMIMLDAVVVYRSEAFHGDVLLIEVGVTHVDAHSCDFVYRMKQKASGREIATAKTTIAFFDYDKRKIVGTPAAFAERVRVRS